MPNWVTNKLYVSGPDVDVDRFRARAASLAEETALDFQAFVPMPAGLEKGCDGYEWARQNWGCKWEPAEAWVDDKDQAEEGLCFRFDSANEAPVVMLSHFLKAFPMLRFILLWSEPDTDYYGRAEAFDGDVSEEKLERSPFPGEGEYVEVGSVV